MNELAKSSRSWLVTLTFHPEVRARMEMAARKREGEEAWREASPERRSIMLAREAQDHVTLWMKRVRAQSGAALRYLLVTEKHKDGFPHCHVLLHEGRGVPVRHATITRQWVVGFSNAKLVEQGEVAARYVSKYLSKSPVTRVRASVGYGHDGDKTI